MLRLPPALALVSSLLAACASCGRQQTRSSSLEYGSAADVEAILRANGVAPGPLHCANPSYDGAVTRAVACTTRLSAADLAALRSGVPLQPGKAAPYGHQDSCEATPGFGSTGPDLEVLVGKNTKVPNGVGTLELHVARGTGEACIEIHYPWSS